MSSDINLISGDSNILSKEAARIRKFRLVATSIVFGVGFISIFLFLLNRILSPQSIIDQQGETIKKISTFQTKQAKVLILTQRINDISSLLKKRVNYDVVLSSILSQSPSDISITSLSVDKKEISTIVSSSSLLSLNELINIFKEMVEKKQFIKNVTINSLNLNGKFSGYVLTVDMELL